MPQRANSTSFKKGQTSPRKGIKGVVKLSLETRKKMSLSRLGKKRNIETIEKMSKTMFKKGHSRSGWVRKKFHTDEAKKKMSLARLGRFKGEDSPTWIKDRSKLKKSNRRNDPSYVEWRRNVQQRDGFKCKVFNSKCDGRIEAHHILGWTEYPELRYQVNNGITLCHAHHPKKRAEEKRLAPEFQALVSVSRALL